MLIFLNLYQIANTLPAELNEAVNSFMHEATSMIKEFDDITGIMNKLKTILIMDVLIVCYIYLS